EGGLVAELDQSRLDDAARLVRAFATYFQLVNLAELERQARSVREGGDERGELERLLAECAAQRVPAERIARLLQELEVRPVLTAHPTEAVRRSILDHQDRIGHELTQLRAQLSTRERNRVRQRIATQVEVLWHTDEVRSVRPRVLDEVGNALFYLERTFFDAIPDVHRQLAEALARHYPGIHVPLNSPIRLGSWVGSDQDGNPNANAAMLTETLRLQRRTLLTRYREREAELADYAETLSPGTKDEPYRRKLSFVWRRLGATLEGEPVAYASADDLAADLDLLDVSLRRHAGAAVADSDLLRFRRRVRAFGFMGARLA